MLKKWLAALHFTACEQKRWQKDVAILCDSYFLDHLCNEAAILEQYEIDVDQLLLGEKLMNIHIPSFYENVWNFH